MKLKSLLLLSAALLLMSPLAAQQGQGHFAKYHGAWFDIDYPAGWKATSLGRSTSSTTGSDTARFTSPDGSAEFYVFSPRWNGDPAAIKLDPRREVLVSSRLQSVNYGKLRGDHSSNVAHWYTARAKDHLYERSWVDVEDKGLNVRHVLGIKYRSLTVYQKYKPLYAHFCKSLAQFAD